MEVLPRLRKEVRVAGDPDRITGRLAVELPRHGIMIQQHQPGLRVVGIAFRPFSFSMGVEVRVDCRPVDRDHVDAIIESRFLYPWIDFSQENEKNVALVEGILTEAPQTASA